jgi:hypothetical protein
MNVWGVGHNIPAPCTATFSDLLCFPFWLRHIQKRRPIKKRQVGVEHYNPVSCVKDTHLLTAVHSQTSDVLHGVHKCATHKETDGALGDLFGDQHLAIEYYNQLKTWTQDIGEFLQEFATTIEQVSHHAFLASHEDHIHKGQGQSIWWQDRRLRCKAAATSGDNKTLNKAFRQTLELEVLKLTVGFSARLWKTSDKTWSQKEEEASDSLSAGHFWKFSPHRLEEKMATCLKATRAKQP